MNARNQTAAEDSTDVRGEAAMTQFGAVRLCDTPPRRNRSIPTCWGRWHLNLWRRYLSYRINLAAAIRNSRWVPAPADFTVGPREVANLCPKCAGDYTHLVNAFLQPDRYEAEVYRRVKAVGTVGEHPDCLAVEFEGKCGHVFEWRIQQHKGNSFVTAEFVGNNERSEKPENN